MFVLPDLPYGYDSLEPTLSADTLRLHHDKHHKKYVDTVNELIGGRSQGDGSLEDVVRQAAKDGEAKLFNNAGQAWNHGFYWQSMSPDAGAPDGGLEAAITRDFGDGSKLRAKFVEEGMGHFGSGWVWLALDDGRLTLTTTHDGDCILTRPQLRPLLLCDLWEHAYYLDYQNDRKAYLEAWFDRLANWSFAGLQLSGSELWRYPARVAETA